MAKNSSPSSFAAWKANVLSAVNNEREFESANFQGAHVTNLVETDRQVGLGGKTVISLKLANDRSLPFFDSGTPVVLAMANASLAKRREFSGLVVANDPLKISLSSKFDLDDDSASQRVWTLDQAQDETTFKRIEKALTAMDDSKWTRLLFNENQKPIFASLADPVEFFNPNLNATQKAAVERALECRDVFAIHGPPGTGKSSVLVEIIRQLASMGRYVLACAPSNVAVDNLLLRLAQCKLSCIRLGHPSR